MHPNVRLLEFVSSCVEERMEVSGVGIDSRCGRLVPLVRMVVDCSGK